MGLRLGLGLGFGFGLGLRLGLGEGVGQGSEAARRAVHLSLALSPLMGERTMLMAPTPSSPAAPSNTPYITPSISSAA